MLRPSNCTRSSKRVALWLSRATWTTSATVRPSHMLELHAERRERAIRLSISADRALDTRSVTILRSEQFGATASDGIVESET
eukprot:3857837-Prymnesium_polylepis.1